MKTKTKLTLGVGLLFLMILLLSVIATWYLNALKTETENILVSNYNSLLYSRNMLQALDAGTDSAIVHFDANLLNQERNITEPGEQAITQRIKNNFGQFKLNRKNLDLSKMIRLDIYNIMDLNLTAIDHKSEVAKATASIATTWIAVAGTICFLIAFTLLFNLPANIADPIKKLSESIKQIAAENYFERVHFKSHSEFGDLANSFNTMAQKLEEYNNSNLAKLMMEKKRIETLINNMHDPVIGLDEEQRIVFANESAIKIIGLNPRDILNQSAIALAKKNDLIRILIQDIQQPTDHFMSGKVKTLKIFADAKESYFEKDVIQISVTPEGEPDQKLSAYVILLRNITAYKELDAAKTTFIANVSHEFKTPISSIKMSLQLLGNDQVGQLNEEQKNLLESIGDDTNRLLKITGELTNMTQVESGNIQLSVIPSDPKEILLYAVNATRNLADQRHITLEFHSPEKLPLIQADNEKTSWVLTNLIMNAINYSHDHARVLINVVPVNGIVKFEVKDTGQGIDSKYKAKIFDRYFKIPGSKKEGTGLGLAISKEFIEAQGGRISVESELGQGSTFTVTLNSLSEN
ncbi:MAG: ATP-binding protein [Saprospiraceae bacterium]